MVARIFAVFFLGCVALSQATVPIGTIFDKTLPRTLTESQLRILGGAEASRNEYPYQVAIISSDSINPGEADGFCGGSLISRNAVLTAAHCVDTYRISNVVLGTNRALDSSSAGYTVIRASYKVLHPQFDLSLLDNDIALLILESDAPLGTNIQPVLLPRRNQNTNLDNTVGRLTGWGKDGDASGFVTENLMEVDVNIVNNQECIAAYGVKYVNGNNACVSTSGGSVGPCHGDSGGPLTIRTGIPATTVQVGVVSFGAAQGCESGYPTVFSRVTSYLDWIASNGGPAVRP